MDKREFKPFFLIAIFVFFIFFSRLIVNGLIPFPGDLLIAEYNPWKTYSYLGYLPGSFPTKFQYFDVLRQIYPWKNLVIASLKEGIIPLWNPYNFSGSPLMANFQSAVFYPLNFLYLILPQVKAWTLLMILQPILTFLFTYLYSRKISLSPIASVFSSLSFSFCYFLSVWFAYNTLGHVILWLPLALFSFEKFIESKKIKWQAIFLISLTSSLFAGHIQVFFYLFAFVFIYIIYRAYHLKDISLFLQFLFVGILSLGLGSVQLFPGFELIINSARSDHSYKFILEKLLIQPYQIVMLLVPDFFGNPATRNYYLPDTYIGKVMSIGLVPLFFATLTLLFKKNNIIKFFISSLLFIFVFTTLNPFSMIFYKLNIPLISSSSPTLMIFIFSFCLSIAAGYGVDVYRHEKLDKKKYFYWISPFAFIFLILLAAVIFLPELTDFVWAQKLRIGINSLLLAIMIFVFFSSIIFVSLNRQRVKYVVLLMLFLVTVFDLWRGFNRFNPFVPDSLVFPEAKVLNILKEKGGIDRFWGYQAAHIEANFATQLSLYSPEGYDPLYPRTYGEFISTSFDGKIEKKFTTETRSDAKISQEHNTSFLDNFYRTRVINLLGVKYIVDRVENLSTDITFSPNSFNLIYSEDGWKIYENKNSLPRAFFAGSYRVFKTSREFEEIFFDKSLNPRETILLEESLEKKIKKGIMQEVNIVSYEPNKIIVDTQSDTDSLLFVSDTFYPGWRALVDEKETRIYKANYSFRAVFVPEGKHRVTFMYMPDSFRIGAMMSGVSLLTLATFAISFTYFKRRKQS